MLATLTLATAVAARLGTVTLVAHQIALQVWLFVTIAFDVLAIPAQTITGTLLGEGRPVETRRYGRRLCRLGTWSGAAVGGTILALSGVLPHVFTGDPRVAGQATIALVAVGVLQVPDAVLFVLDGILMGASDFRFLQASTVAGLVAFVPVAIAVSVWHRLGIAGIWLGLGVWLLARLAVNSTRYRGSSWMSAAASQ